MKYLFALVLLLTSVSANAHNQQQNNPNVQGTTTGGYVVYVNGKRDHRAELRLMQQQMHNNNGRQGIRGYTSDRWDREWDHRVKRKIDKEMDRFLDRIGLD